MRVNIHSITVWDTPIIAGTKYTIQYSVSLSAGTRKHIRRHWPRKAAKKALRWHKRSHTHTNKFRPTLAGDVWETMSLTKLGAENVRQKEEDHQSKEG